MTATSSCTIKPIVAPKNKAIGVNGVEITRAAISQETQNHPAAKPIDAWMAAARAQAIRELLLQEARRLGLDPQPATDGEARRETPEEALVRAVIEHEVVTPEPDGETCRRYYDQNAKRFRSADLFEVSHILFAADPRDKEVRASARRLAESAIERLEEAPGTFEDMARAHSACPSREVGGNLGQIGPGQTVPEFERALTTRSLGSVEGPPIETRYGFHIVRVNRHEPGRQLPFDLVCDRITDYLSEHVRRTAIRQYISQLAGRSVITGIDLAASNDPLVQ